MEISDKDDEIYGLDEGSWIYLGLPESASVRKLHPALVQACEDSGWAAVTWSSPQTESRAGSARFLDGMSHAVAHADAVVVFVDATSTAADAELALARRHNRPVIVLELDSGDRPPDVQAMLNDYGRAFSVECDDVQGCSTGLRRALADSEFAEIVNEAARESTTHV